MDMHNPLISLAPRDQGLHKWRWVIILGIGMPSVAFDVFEFINLHNSRLSFEFLYELIFEGVIVPLLVVLLMGYVERLTIEKTLALQRLSHKEMLQHQINSAPSWEALVKVMISFPRGVVPLNGSALLLREPDSGRFRLEAIWGFYAKTPPIYDPAVDWACVHGEPGDLSTPVPVFSCACAPASSIPQGNVRYCLPLVSAGKRIAILHLYLPSGSSLNPEQEHLLSSLAAEMALALDNARHQQLYSRAKESAEAERKRIARSMHDNLAQDLVYLRLKLDQLSGEESLGKIADIQQDLLRMREVANEAYLSVRNTLKDMESSPSTNLDQTLDEYFRSVEKRFDFEMYFTRLGLPCPLPAETVQQVRYILKELLVNVEKHARAQKVEVRLSWKRDAFILSVQDDGCGFMPANRQVPGHMGLGIIRERAQEIGGSIAIHSRVGSGTEVKLSVPLASRAEMTMQLKPEAVGAKPGG